MISVETAQALADAGVMWEPQAGDRFVIRAEELGDQVFWVSELTIEVHHHHDQTVLGFNGTTEWALDSIPVDRTLWLPREDQLRVLLGDRLRSLVRTGEGWVVTTPGGEVGHHDAEEAYARALLAGL